MKIYTAVVPAKAGTTILYGFEKLLTNNLTVEKWN